MPFAMIKETIQVARWSRKPTDDEARETWDAAKRDEALGLPLEADFDQHARLEQAYGGWVLTSSVREGDYIASDRE